MSITSQDQKVEVQSQWGYAKGFIASGAQLCRAQTCYTELTKTRHKMFILSLFHGVSHVLIKSVKLSTISVFFFQNFKFLMINFFL